MYNAYRPSQRFKRLVNPEAKDFLANIRKRSLIPEENFEENARDGADIKPCSLAVLPMTVTKGKNEAFYSFKVILMSDLPIIPN